MAINTSPDYQEMKLKNTDFNKVIEKLVIPKFHLKRKELADILFVLDATWSMQWILDSCKDTIIQIINKYAKSDMDIKFALCFYRDHQPQEREYLYKQYDLRDSLAARAILQTIWAKGGGDFPEAAMDGLREGIMKTNWRTTGGPAKKDFKLAHFIDST